MNPWARAWLGLDRALPQAGQLVSASAGVFPLSPGSSFRTAHRTSCASDEQTLPRTRQCRVMAMTSSNIRFLAVFLILFGIEDSLCDSIQNITSFHRWKRQSCGMNMFKCRSGECISAALACNGEKNCNDRSDETSEICLNSVIPVLSSFLNPPLVSYVNQCPPYQFQCDNGNCIHSRKRCDTKIDCSDGSDEKQCENVCGPGQFKCRNGLCLASDHVCNGLPDCTDQSDETLEECESTRCTENQFRCEYGACVPSDAMCDNKSHCADGSDESSKLCSPTSPSTPSRVTPGCKLPSQPANGKYHVWGCELPNCDISPGTAFQNYSILNFTCNPGFKLSGPRIIWCYNEMWSSPFPTCNRALCPALMNPTRRFECFVSGTIVNCSEPMLPETRATIRCADYYITSLELSNYDITCRENGEWSNIVHSCTPECGLPNANSLPLIANGRKANVAEFPWHVGIYTVIEDKMQQICGGSIVSSQVVITAAHCFWDENQKKLVDISSYRIAAGKYSRDWNNRSNYFQESPIDQVYVGRTFRGNQGFYEADIAVVKLKNEFLINEAIRPICLDFSKRFSEDFKPGINGVVLGWGFTENQTQAEELRAILLPYEERGVCMDRSRESFIPYLIVHDKFCVGTNTGKTVCPGDSGGGFAARFKGGRNYYLMGVVSVGVVPQGNDQCDVTQYSSFTKVSEYYSFIRPYLFV